MKDAGSSSDPISRSASFMADQGREKRDESISCENFSFLRLIARLSSLVPCHIGLSDGAGERADAGDIGDALRHRYRAARVQQIERVRTLHDVFVCRLHEPSREQAFGFRLITSETLPQEIHISQLKVVFRELAL